MGKLRWYKRDPVAALEGMSDLSLEEKGAYNTVLDLIYARDGKVDDDDRFISGWLRCDVRVWRRIKTKLLERGKLYLEAGSIRNSRADAEVSRGLSLVASASEAGKASARKKSDVKSKIKDIEAATVGAVVSTNSTTTTTPTEDNTELRSVSSDRRDDGWPADYREAFWRAYPRKLEKKAALLSLERVRKSGAVSWAKLIAAVRGYAATADPQFTKHPTTWLSKGCWDDEIQPRGQHESPGFSRANSNPGPPQTHGDAVMAGMARFAEKRRNGQSTDTRNGFCGRDDIAGEPVAHAGAASGNREPSRQLALVPVRNTGK